MGFHWSDSKSPQVSRTVPNAPITIGTIVTYFTPCVLFTPADARDFLKKNKKTKGQVSLDLQ